MCAHNLSTEDLWGSLASNYKVLNKRFCLKREKKGGDGEMPQQLRRHNALLKDESCIPRDSGWQLQGI